MVLALLLLLAATAAPANFEESFRAGLLALQRNDLAAAQTNLEAAAGLQPANGRVWVALSQTYRKLNDASKADAAAAKAQTFGRTDPVVQSTLVMYYAEAGRMHESADAQANYAALVPQDAAARDRAEAAYFQLAQTLLQQGKFTEAIPILRSATQHISKSAQLELALGVACYGLRRFDDAAAAFLRTIAIAPEIAQSYVFLGNFLDQIPSRLPEVTKRFVEYETAHPTEAAGYLLHAKALNAQSIDPATARKLLEKALSIDDRDAAAHFELGVMLDTAKHYREAMREFLRAAELNPADPAPHYRLSRIYDRLGKRDAAQTEREIHAKLEQAQDAAKR